ncbi:unnamed protein product, partial [Sphacelaria rigidula]
LHPDDDVSSVNGDKPQENNAATSAGSAVSSSDGPAIAIKALITSLDATGNVAAKAVTAAATAAAAAAADMPPAEAAALASRTAPTSPTSSRDRRPTLTALDPDVLALCRQTPGGAVVVDVLIALLTSTIVAADGTRVLAPTFPAICSHHEFKYCGPMGAPQASAISVVVHERRGVLLHLNLAGKRLGDESVMLLAPALATIRHVDLRYNNIGDNGAIAIAGAVRAAAIIAARKVKVGSGGRMKSDTT